MTKISQRRSFGGILVYGLHDTSSTLNHSRRVFPVQPNFFQDLIENVGFDRVFMKNGVINLVENVFPGVHRLLVK